MSKKIFIIIAIFVVLAVVGVGGYLVLNGKSKSSSENIRSTSLLPKTSKEETAKVTADVLYEDSSGFSFKYPKDVKVSDVTPSGDEYYTQLNLVRGSDKIIITVKDTTAKTVDDWLKSDSNYSGASLVGATTLGGVSAKQYSKGNILITAAIDQAVLYLIVGPKDGGFWEDVQGSVISTFKFSGTVSSSGTFSGSSDVVNEEEEVIE